MKLAVHVLALGAAVTLSSCAVPYVETRSPRVKGVVLDAVSKKPVKGALITPLGTTHPSSKSKADGRFVLAGSKAFGFWFLGPCPKGPQYKSYDEIEISREGYLPAREKVGSIWSPENGGKFFDRYYVEVQLKPSSQPLPPPALAPGY